MDRRSFIQTACASLVVLLTQPGLIIKAAIKKIAIPLSKLPDLKKIGGYIVLKIKGKQVLFIRPEKDSVKAYCARCSHAESILEYHHDAGHINCPLHGSKFDLDGNPIKGPATEPICQYDTTLQDEKIKISMDVES